MAVDTLTAVQLSRNAGVDGKAATVMTAINAANTMELDCSAIDMDRLVLHVKNTEGTSNVVTVAAGDFSRKDLGALAVTVAATTGEQLIHVRAPVSRSPRVKSQI
jgi:hypothetical protein